MGRRRAKTMVGLVIHTLSNKCSDVCITVLVSLNFTDIVQLCDSSIFCNFFLRNYKKNGVGVSALLACGRFDSHCLTRAIIYSRPRLLLISE